MGLTQNPVDHTSTPFSRVYSTIGLYCQSDSMDEGSRWSLAVKWQDSRFQAALFSSVPSWYGLRTYTCERNKKTKTLMVIITIALSQGVWRMGGVLVLPFSCSNHWRKHGWKSGGFNSTPVPSTFPRVTSQKVRVGGGLENRGLIEVCAYGSNHQLSSGWMKPSSDTSQESEANNWAKARKQTQNMLKVAEIWSIAK